MVRPYDAVLDQPVMVQRPTAFQWVVDPVWDDPATELRIWLRHVTNGEGLGNWYWGDSTESWSTLSRDADGHAVLGPPESHRVSWVTVKYGREKIVGHPGDWFILLPSGRVLIMGPEDYAALFAAKEA